MVIWNMCRVQDVEDSKETQTLEYLPYLKVSHAYICQSKISNTFEARDNRDSSEESLSCAACTSSVSKLPKDKEVQIKHCEHMLTCLTQEYAVLSPLPKDFNHAVKYSIAESCF
jgi:hypothetical protein